MGLVQRAIEAAGLPTVSISLVKALTLQVRPPRAVFLRWPLGHPLGEPGHRAQQRQVLLDALGLLETAPAPGALLEPGY
ncbi:MAG: selenoprotein B, partial [Nitrospinota bacterium]